MLIKRDGTLQSFDRNKITNAIRKAFKATNQEITNLKLSLLVDEVINEINIPLEQNGIIHVEQIQDIVEQILMKNEYYEVAKAYILYRKQREEIRNQIQKIPEEYRKLILEDMKYFDNDPYRYFIFLRTYSRYDWQKKRRETWVETVDRTINFLKSKVGNKLSDEEWEELRNAILWQEVLPSNRLLWSAGKAAEYDNMTIYNCCFVAPQTIKDFADIFYILMCGTGVGFTVEPKVIDKLPTIKKQKDEPLIKHIIEDSREGWAEALRVGMEAWFNGYDVEFDFSKIRPAGTPLKTMGGRASGPEPLKECLNYIKNKILSNQGKKLKPIEVHDIICYLGKVVVVGGVRRTALISLSDLDDIDLKTAKFGNFYIIEPQRAYANNSTIYEEKPDIEVFLDEWLNLIKGKSGERGIFNRYAVRNTIPKRRKKFLRGKIIGGNPCGEIILQSHQLCNLSVIVARENDDISTLTTKARLASILGTIQSTFTDFKYVSEEFKKNCEEERLLGVSITGYWDCEAVRDEAVLKKLKDVVIETNLEYSKRLGINPSTAVTAIKPSGNTGELTNSSSGIHPRFARYYIRRVRIAKHDPLAKMLIDQKIPYKETQTEYIFEFPRKTPDNAITARELSAIEQLEEWKKVKLNYTEHNPSVTIYVKEHEWLDVAKWIYDNFDIASGISFLPLDDHVYENAPLEECDEETYKKMQRSIDFSWLILYENEDMTTGSKELGCAGGVCELT